MKYFIDREASVLNGLNFVADAEERRKTQTMMDSGTEIFYMRNLRDLSAREGTLVCIEYSEEHPPLLSLPGMASKIRNYYRRVNHCKNYLIYSTVFRKLKKKLMFSLNLAKLPSQ